MNDYAEPSTLVLIALLIGIALGTLSGSMLVLDWLEFPVDNRVTQ